MTGGFRLPRSRRHVFFWLAQASLLIKIALSSLFANTGFPISVLLPKKAHCEIDADDSSAKVTSHHITSCHITSTPAPTQEMQSVFLHILWADPSKDLGPLRAACGVPGASHLRPRLLRR